MQIKKILVENYRGHKALEVSFSSKFNVIVGTNGSGKTSVLRALNDSFIAFAVARNVPIHSWGFEEGDVRVERLDFDGRLRFEPQYPARIEVDACLAGQDAHWVIERTSSSGGAPSIRNHEINNIWDRLKGAEEPALPILAFYRSSRHWFNVAPNEFQAITGKAGRIGGYFNYYDASADIGNMQGWVISKCLERFQSSSETGLKFDEIKDDELALVNVALSTAIPELMGIRYDMREKNILVDWNADERRKPRTTAFSHLSDGQRSVVGLIVDIARRMCMLNPHLGMSVTRLTPGVVLIDELDMHLHPKWQRTITKGLQDAFPSVQFIVATHSPQVLGEITPEQILILNHGRIESPVASYGLDSSAILEEIMDAPIRSVNVEQDLRSLFSAIERNKIDEARAILNRIKHESPGLSEASRAEMLLRRKEAFKQ